MDYKGYKSQPLDFMIYADGTNAPFVTITGTRSPSDDIVAPPASVSISDEEILVLSDSAKTGHTLVIINPNTNVSVLNPTEILETLTVETYNTSNQTGLNGLIARLEEINADSSYDGKLICLLSYGVCQVSEALRDQLKKLGGTATSIDYETDQTNYNVWVNDTNSESISDYCRTAHAFIGMKGLPQGHAQEDFKRYHPDETDHSISVTTFFEATPSTDQIYALTQGKTTNYYSDINPAGDKTKDGDNYGTAQSSTRKAIKEGDCWFDTGYHLVTGVTFDTAESCIGYYVQETDASGSSSYLKITRDNLDKITVGENNKPTSQLYTTGLLLQWTKIAENEYEWTDIGSELVTNKLTANYINALDITAKKIEVLDNTEDKNIVFYADAREPDKVQIGKFAVDSNSISFPVTENSTQYKFGKEGTVLICTGTEGVANIGGSGEINGWNFTAGTNFGVRTNKTTGASELYASKGKIGGFDLLENSLQSTNKDPAYFVSINSNSSVNSEALYSVTSVSYVPTTGGSSINPYGFQRNDERDLPGYSCYESKNIGVPSSLSVLKVNFNSAIPSLDIYIKSAAESNYDYTIASTLNATRIPTGGLAGTDKNTWEAEEACTKATTKGKQTGSDTRLFTYSRVRYQDIHKGDFLYIVYKKDSTINSMPDTGWVLLPNGTNPLVMTAGEFFALEANGNIQCESGSIGGIEITRSGLKSSNENFELTNTGQLKFAQVANSCIQFGNTFSISTFKDEGGKLEAEGPLQILGSSGNTGFILNSTDEEAQREIAFQIKVQYRTTSNLVGILTRDLDISLVSANSNITPMQEEIIEVTVEHGNESFENTNSMTTQSDTKKWLVGDTNSEQFSFSLTKDGVGAWVVNYLMKVTVKIADKTYSGQYISSKISTDKWLTMASDTFIQNSFADKVEVIGNLLPSITPGESETLSAGYSLGSTDKQWGDLYAKNGHFSGTLYTPDGKVSSSDREIKNTIQPLLKDVRYEKLFDSLQPTSYKLNKGTSGRTHTGLVAQNLKQAILDSGFTTQEVAAYCEWEIEDPKTKEKSTTCGIRYEELIPLNIHETQKLKKRVTDLEAELNELKSKLN